MVTGILEQSSSVSSIVDKSHRLQKLFFFEENIHKKTHVLVSNLDLSDRSELVLRPFISKLAEFRDFEPTDT